jgi:aminoglycoside phosphotransferase (APT) family kinase protein
MHADELFSDAALVRELVASQLPEFADLDVTPVESWGTDNTLYRLGTDFVVRMPRRPGASAAFDWDSRWLPRLAPHLPVAIPQPIAAGTASEPFPYPWGVYRWLNGQDATQRTLDTPDGASDLASFIHALQRVDADGGPPPGAHNANRGVPLAVRDASFRRYFAMLQDGPEALEPDRAQAALAIWERALAAPAWNHPPVWLHGDLLPANLLVDDRGRLSAVIDWGCMAIGDPACELMAAWSVFSNEARQAFERAVDADDAMWARARGWSLSQGVAALAYYHQTNPVLARVGRRGIGEVLADSGA